MSTILQIATNGVQLTVWTWGSRDSPPLLLIHGWGDSGGTFEHVAAALADDFYVVAPALRGFGDSEWAPDGYWFPNYLADLEVVANTLFGNARFALVGHSMGGNIAGLYAGIRAERISHLVLLEGFGLPPTLPAQAPTRYRRWLDGKLNPPPLRDFASFDALCAHLSRLAPRISTAVLTEIAQLWARPLADGQWRLKMDPKHKQVNPVLYRREEAIACWRDTTAPVLLVAARESDLAARFPKLDVLTETTGYYRHATHVWVEDAGHMLHWEQPGAVASLICSFIQVTA
jgi:pimeloyl-ACP methyl ester carboxylesterase